MEQEQQKCKQNRNHLLQVGEKRVGERGMMASESGANMLGSQITTDRSRGEAKQWISISSMGAEGAGGSIGKVGRNPKKLVLRSSVTYMLMS